MLPYNKNLIPYARELRNNMTDAEKYLWSKVRMKQLKSCQFYRQRIIGNYIIDFFCPGANLVIEVDGGQHYSVEIIDANKQRDEYMRSQGLKVLRFANTEVLNDIEGVVGSILENMGEQN